MQQIKSATIKNIQRELSFSVEEQISGKKKSEKE